MDLELPQGMKDIISSMKYLNKKKLQIKLGKKYNDKQLIIPFDHKKVQQSCENLEKCMKEAVNILHDDYIQIENILCTQPLNDGSIVEFEDSGKLEDTIIKQIKKKEFVVNKYSQNRKGMLCESVFINGEPLFLELDDTLEEKDNNLILRPFIEENSRILMPPYLEECLHNSYDFETKDEIIYFISKARKETIFSLYTKTKSIVSKYIDQDSHIINLITIYIVFSYFQDRFSTVHYIGIFGDNGSGKSSIGDMYEALGYRPMNTTDPTPANIFRSLGGVEPGQISLILDEAEKVDQSQDMMSLLKTGYDIRKQVSRINQISMKPERFFPFCQKIIIGERPPSPNIAKGVNERILGETVYFGNPQYDIKEILNPTDTGSEEFKTLFNEIDTLRKTLIIFRLQHFRDNIKNIDIGISWRNKELVKPYLQLFSNPKTESDVQVYKEIKNTFQIFLKIKNNKKEFTLERALLPIIIDLMKLSNTSVVKFSDFWNKILTDIRGNFDEKRPNEYHTEDFGIIYRNSVSTILQKLGVDSKRHNQYVQLLFNPKKIIRNSVQYNIFIQTNLKDIDGERSERSERSTGSQSDNISSLEADKPNESIEIVKMDTKNYENYGNNSQNSKASTLENAKDAIHRSKEHSQPTRDHPSNGNYEVGRKKNNSIYRIGNTDTWACSKCKFRDDKWFMQEHPCK